MNIDIFWGFQKNKYSFGYEDFVDVFFLGHHKIGLYLGVISMHFFGLFLRAIYRIGDIFGVAKISNIFGVP